MLGAHRRNGYATSSFDGCAIKAEKEMLRAQGYPIESALEFVDRFLNFDRFGHLRGRDNMFLVAPSTSRMNPIPLVFAQKLAGRFGGSVVSGWATPLSKTKAAKKGGIGKIREPVRFAGDSKALSSLKMLRDRNFVLVDDVVTTGETADALRDSLNHHGIRLNEVVSLCQADMRKVSVRDIERLAAKLGEPSLRAEVAAVLSGKLKHRANYIERTTYGRYISEIRDYFQSEAREYKRRICANAVSSFRFALSLLFKPGQIAVQTIKSLLRIAASWISPAASGRKPTTGTPLAHYKQTATGVAWSLIRPLVTMLIFNIKIHAHENRRLA